MDKPEFLPSNGIGIYLQKILSKITNPVIFEIGVHWAESTGHIMGSCTSKPDYYGFEPDKRNLQRIARMKLPYQMVMMPMAVGNTDGVVTLHLSDGIHHRSGNQMTGANSIRKPKEVKKRHAWINFKQTVEVLCCKLDTYCEANNIDHIDFVWADMQGAEYDMLLGAKNILPEIRYLYLEYADIELYEGQKSVDDYMELLNKNGNWKILHQYRTDVLIENEDLN